MLLVGLLVVSVSAGRAVDAASWLDRPLAPWNTLEARLPQAQVGREARDKILNRCTLTPRQSTPAERLLAAAGWVPFLQFDRQLVRDDVEIVGGMTAADNDCRPVDFNIFVFVWGRFAGTLSPNQMTSTKDGSAGAIRIGANDTITADFARYVREDLECCPSSHVTVRYQITRKGGQAVVTPIRVTKTRG